MAQSYSLTVQSVDELSWKSTGSRLRPLFSKPKLVVKVYVDGVYAARTTVVKGTLRPVWGETLTLTLSSPAESALLTMEVNHESSCFGFVKTTVGDLLRLCAQSPIAQLRLQQRIKNNEAAHDVPGLMSLGITAIDAGQARKDVLSTAQQDAQYAQLAPGQPEPGDSNSVPANLAVFVSNNGDVFEALGTALNKIQVIANVTANAVGEIAKIHPYANAAWQVLDAVRKAYQAQKETDADAVALLGKIAALYSFVDDIDGLPGKMARLERTISLVLKQTTECGIFIREYTDHGFMSRLLGQATSNRSQRLSQLSTALDQLQEDLNTGLRIQTAVMSSQTGRGVDRLVTSDILKGLDPAKMDAAQRGPCLAGTRQDMLKDIFDWLLSPSEGQNIYWLHGAAGLGKSTLANTVAEYFTGLGRQGAFLFFDRNAPVESDPGRVIRTLAYQLAEHDRTVQSAISAAIDRSPGLVRHPLRAQFASLLLEPLAAAPVAGPIVIILDALDECGKPESRKELLVLLSKDLAKLPRQFRFLITSRPDDDIANAFDPVSNPNVHAVDLITSASYSDVQLYISYEMNCIYDARHRRAELSPGWHGELVIQRLAAFAAGLFIWAATAMKFLRYSEDPVESLNGLLSQDGDLFTLDELYKTALLSAGQWQAGKMTEKFRLILGVIVISQVPLTDATITDLLALDSSGRACRNALRRLGCVIQWSEGQPALTLHKSFPDYLTDRARCSAEPWFIDVREHQRALTTSCFRLMNSQLRFNICDLESSYVSNKDVAGLSTRVESCIPQQISYPCCFWADHLGHAIAGDRDILSLILEFFETRFFYWLEVLSLLQKAPIAVMALQRIKLYVANTQSELHVFAQDGISFVRTFATVITESAPHIYLSCIPFAPRSSILKQKYSNVISKILVVDIGLQDNWSPCQQVIEEHADRVRSVAFSPDGQRLACSHDGTIRIWDAESGSLRVGPFKWDTRGDTKGVASVIFSPDGQRLASGSDDGNVHIWDAISGALKAGPFKGHSGGVASVVFSPDGRYVASGSSDGSICIWEAESGVLKAGPFKGHASGVASVAYSPDGQRVASGSSDNTIRVWDAKTGVLAAGPFTGHEDGVLSVAFSPDGRKLVSGSRDLTIRVWDAHTGQEAHPPLYGHKDWVWSVIFSPDGQRIASGSEDSTICIWDAQSGVLKSGPFKGHASGVASVVFSPDGKRVASGSSDSSIRIWDAESEPLNNESFAGHTDWVRAMAFSPDGQRVASCSSDMTIRIWDVSGVLKAGPFTEHTDWVWSVAFSPDGQLLASGSEDCTICIWDTVTGALKVGPFADLESAVRSVAFSPDGLLIASGSDDGNIYIWDAKSGALKAGPLTGHKNWVWCLAFSPDGQHIVSGSEDSTICIWDIVSGVLKAGPLTGHTEAVGAVVFTSDGQHVASGSEDTTVCIWDLSGALKAGPLAGHTEAVRCVAFLPDNQCVASCSRDTTICIWETMSGALKAGPFGGRTNTVVSLAFSPDRKRVASGSADGTVRIWGAQFAGEHLYNGFQPDSQIRENGWMVNPPSKLLFWVPHEYRQGLWWPNSTAVIAEESARLDMTQFVRGEHWAQCHR